jgi:AcrR family transcriptional regulator
MAKTERGNRTRARLIVATTEVVRTHGYPGATVRLIAEAAGVTEATIYRHFADKVDLFFAAVVEQHAPVLAWAAALPGRAGSRTVAANLLETYEQLAVLGRDLAPLELSILADPELARRRSEAQDLSIGPPASIAEYLSNEQALGRVRLQVDPTEVAAILLSTLFGIVAGQLDAREPADNRLMRAAIEMVTVGLLPHGKSDA